MSKCKSSKCGCRKRISSNVVAGMPDGCFDVCTNPICGSPSTLSLFAPLIYDEIGINLCTTFAAGVDISTTYPTATNASVSVVDMTYTYGDDNVEINPISGRPNCYAVTLANLQVQFAVNFYDDACRLLGTEFPIATYLAPETDPEYDEETNPSSVELEIFAPYGVAYNPGVPGTDPTPALSSISQLSSANYVRQGLNIYGIGKLLDMDTTEDTLTVGLTLVLQSLYFAGYRVASEGKINTPKGSIINPEDSECRRFVAGKLLNLAIKPLDLGPFTPALKNDCTEECKDDCVDAQNLEADCFLEHSNMHVQ